MLPDDKRRPLCNMLLKVDAEAKPFRERLELEASINEDLVLTVTALSLNQQGREEAEVHDVESALATPGLRAIGSVPGCWRARTARGRLTSLATW